MTVFEQKSTYRENFAHDFLGFASHVSAEVVERLEVRLVEGVTNDLDVHLVQVLLVDATLEERS
jgi:hypothetical protein